MDQIHSASLVGDAIGAISRHIRERDLMPGDKLPSEALLSKELNVSRTVVREAFRSLAAMRIIELATGKRATVAQIDHGAMSLMIEHGVHTDQINIHQIYDVRRTIETRIVTLAAIRRTDEEAAEILHLAGQMKASLGDPAQLMEYDQSGLFAVDWVFSRDYAANLAHGMEDPPHPSRARFDGANPCRHGPRRGRQRSAESGGVDEPTF